MILAVNTPPVPLPIFGFIALDFLVVGVTLALTVVLTFLPVITYLVYRGTPPSTTAMHHTIIIKIIITNIVQVEYLFVLTDYSGGLCENRTRVNAFAERRLNHSPKRPKPPIFTDQRKSNLQTSIFNGKGINNFPESHHVLRILTIEYPWSILQLQL